MKIIKKGNFKEKEYRKKCDCKTEFSYTNSDVQSDFRDGDYVICPVCGKFLYHGKPPQNFNRATDC